MAEFAHRFVDFAVGKKLERFAGFFHCLLHLRYFIFCKSGEHVIGKVIVGMRLFAYTEFDSREVVTSEMLDDALYSVVSACTSLASDTKTAAGQRDIVKNYDYVFRRYLVKPAGFTDCFTAEIHKRLCKIDFYLRADFPHDTYWKALDIELSDGNVIFAEFQETAEVQTVVFEPRVTEYIHLTNFKQAAFPLSWAALTQIEVYGRYIKEDLSKVEVRNAANSKDAKHYTTDRLREEFLIQNLFTKDNSRMVYSHIDRIITAGFMPVTQELKL